MNRTRSVRLGCLVSLLLSLAGGFFLFERYQTRTSCHENQPPLKIIHVTIDPSLEEQFVEQSRTFAFKHGFRLDTVAFDQPEDTFRIRMIREDVEIITRSPSTPGAFEIGFYNYDCVHPTVASDIEELANDFRTFMSEIPNVRIEE